MKKEKKYPRSFARTLTRWVMLVLFLMMGALGYLIYHVSKSMVVEVSAENFHNNIQVSVGAIGGVMSDVRNAVVNNIYDVERNLDEPDRLQGIMKRIVQLNPNVRSCSLCFVEDYYPQKGRSFCVFAGRDSLDAEPLEESNAYLDAAWFIEALMGDSACWSKPFFFDNRTDKTPMVSYMYPIHNQQGHIAAILSADLALDFMTQQLQRQDSIFMTSAWTVPLSGLNANSIVLKRDGTYITHSDPRRILKGNYFVHIKDADEPGMADLIIDKMSKGYKSSQETFRVVRVNRINTFLFYSPVEGTDWMLVMSVPEFSVDLVGILVGLLMLFIIALVLLVTFFVCRLAIRHAASPLIELAATTDKVASGEFDSVLPDIKSRDEIQLLRDSFENMQHSLTAYIEELKIATTAKASMESELKIAHSIQMSMLPKTYPAFPNRQDIDVYGVVKPAKAVGGDLYDFFIRDEKLFFCIGDVSGKGVPASLVMAVTRSLFRNIAGHEQEANRITSALNEALGNNNSTNMFVTMLLGVLDLSTGLLRYCNAGHNPPLVLTEEGISELACDSNVPVGVFPDWKYTVEELQMKDNDIVFLYTDGLNEAEDSSHNQFGMERMQQMAKNSIKQPQHLIEAMMTAVDLFIGDAEQSDDLTMFAIQFKDIKR